MTNARPKGAQPVSVQFRDVSKRFGGRLVLDRVGFSVLPGTIHAVLGENGAGKSTLMKILMGLLRPDGGEILLRGKRERFRGPRDAIAKRVGMIFQNSTLIRSLTVAENLKLGGNNSTKIAAANLNFLRGIRLQQVVENLSRAERQIVEIQRLLLLDTDILILDEPTSALTPLESTDLFARLSALRAEGKTILFVTHKLHEVVENADRITVLRAGRHVATLETGDVTIPELAQLMIGSSYGHSTGATEEAPRFEGDREVVLEVSGIRLRRDRPILEDRQRVSFKLRAGECIGIAGVAGNGQGELIDALFQERSESETASYFGRPLSARFRSSLAFVPDNASEIAVAPDLSVRDNVMLNDIAASGWGDGLWFDEVELNRKALARLEAFKVRYHGLRSAVRTLSGGNICKLILAREFANDPLLAVIVNPTSGLDISAMEEVRQYLKSAKRRGCSILLVSNDLDEVLDISDRILVLSGGTCIGDMPREQASVSRIAELMGGHISTGRAP